MLNVVEGEDVFVSHHTESLVDGFTIEKHLFCGSINELMAWIKPCTIQIILSSHDILHLRAILGFLQGKAANENALIGYGLCHTLQLCQFAVCPVQLLQNLFGLQIVWQR